MMLHGGTIHEVEFGQDISVGRPPASDLIREIKDGMAFRLCWAVLLRMVIPWDFSDRSFW